MDKRAQALAAHRDWQGKIEVISRAKVENMADLAIAYTPGVAEPCKEIAKEEDLSYTYTRRGNLVAVVTDGTAVLGLGDIGPVAGMPVMEGKCVLFKEFGGIDAFPICIDSKDPDEIVRTVQLISKSFGGINLEDISAPRCFEIERRLQEVCDIPVFHDDQHGTAIVLSAALINALKVVGKPEGSVKIVINGAGAAGISIAKLILQMKLGSVTLVDRQGIIWDGNPENNPAQAEMAKVTNLGGQRGTLADAMRGADVFVGVSRPGLVTREMVATMAEKPILFPMANPTPEIFPDEAKAGGAAVVGTGRSDYPNQVNNILAFPGIFKGALAVRAPRITDSMKEAAARGIAAAVSDDELSADYILPTAFDKRVADIVADAVASEAIRLGINRKARD
ncbi:MAG TPA: NADP-dependent malic enzyme [Candidatus Pygmaiobacter gallistercoris]|nr:NADP-dependent malic enzyme [Candidatus Pygmaiobacter gallistercoris]